MKNHWTVSRTKCRFWQCKIELKCETIATSSQLLQKEHKTGRKLGQDIVQWVKWVLAFLSEWSECRVTHCCGLLCDIAPKILLRISLILNFIKEGKQVLKQSSEIRDILVIFNYQNYIYFKRFSWKMFTLEEVANAASEPGVKF